MKAGGETVARTNQLLAASIVKVANRVASARLVYLDGSAASSDFPLSNAPTFVPGTEIEISAGPPNDAVVIFAGIVIKQSLRVRDHSAPQLVVECRHKATKLTVGRKSAYFHETTDSSVLENILDAAEIEKDIESTSVEHEQLVQFASSDWDFLVTRAEANGRLVLTNDAKVRVVTPSVGAASTSLLFGATVLEMDAELDARDQMAAVTTRTWDAAQQSLVTRDASDPSIDGPGNLAPSALASVVGLPGLPLGAAPVPEAEAQAWADASWRKSRLAKANGRVKCEGIATINPGDTVTLGGVGERFGGDVLVTGVRHELDLVQGWKTHVQFGDTNTWLAEELPVSAPAAGALLPAVTGLQIGVVVSNEDPAGEHRVRVRMPMVDASDDGAWCRVASLDAGNDRGFFFRPEIGDEVVLGFLNDDPRHAIVLGMLHSSAKPAPLKGADANDEKCYQSRSKMRLAFDDSKKSATLSTPAGNSITLSEDEQSITIADQNGNKIALTTDGITIESSKAIALKAGTTITVESGTSLGLTGGTDLTLKGASGAELSSTAVTRVKGSQVMLN